MQETTETIVFRTPTTLRALSAIFLSMGLYAIGSGMMFAYVPIKLSAAGFAPWVAGAMITSLAFGGFIGCLISGHIVRRVGHARAFACIVALVILSAGMIAAGTLPVVWIVARGLYGAAAMGLFIVTQSWLNDASENHRRGRVIALFYTIFVLGIGCGSFLIRFISLEGNQAPLVAMLFATLAILPIGLTRLPAPPPPRDVSIALRTVWKISPAGLAGLLAVGGLTMLAQGFAPIYAAATGYGQSDIATLMFLMQFGMIAVQMPLGVLSDRMDRRYILVASCGLVIAMALSASQVSGLTFAWLIVVFAIWSGATETIYAVANAHANDRADPQYYVSLASTMLIAWSVTGFIVPGVTTALTPVLGPTTFMYMAVVIAALYALFVIYRLTRAGPVPAAEADPYLPISAQAPYSSELAASAADGAEAEGP